MSEDEGEREYDATPHKLEQARQKGDLVRSTDLSVAATYAGLAIAALVFGDKALLSLGALLAGFLDHADTLSHQMTGGHAALGGVLRDIGLAVAPWLIVPGLAVILCLIATRAIVFAPEKLAPKASRINPLANSAQRFGPNGLFEFTKSLIKLMLIAGCLGAFVQAKLPQILMSQQTDARAGISQMLALLSGGLLLVVAIAGLAGAADYLWQRAAFLRRNRMTRKELTDESKQSEGDPHMKAQRRQKGREIASRQMIADVAKASVVVVNPTHYAVALKWERGVRRAPVCVAKGVDEVAARIREVAREASVPIHSDPPTARALYAAIDIGAEIRPEHYKAVAAAIRVAERIRRSARQSRRNG